MDRYEQFRRAAIERGVPVGEVGKFADQLRFAIRLGGGGPDEEAAGQRGGLPRLPVGVEWPGNGSPLPFIASVDCAVLPRVEGLPMPADGSLLFFLHHEDDLEAQADADGPGAARVLYVPAGTDTVVAPAPPGHDGERFFHEDIPFLVPEHRLSAWVEPELPEWVEERDVTLESDVVKQLFDELEHLDLLCELVDDLWPAPDRSATLRLGGHCTAIGGLDTPWTRMARADLVRRHGAFRDLPRAERFRLLRAEEHRLIREWVPLAQFHTESDYYYGCFLMSLDDLAAKRFDRARSFTMFTE